MTTLEQLRSTGVSLALGGGAARGIAHIGVLKALAEAGVAVHAVAGTSVGSVVGAALAAGRDWRWMLEEARRLRWGDLVQPAVPRMGLFVTDRLEQYLERALGARLFSQLSIPFAAVAVDIGAGEEAVLREGHLAPAIRASCSVPGIFAPVSLGGRLLVDGGLLNDVPADVARSLADLPVLAVKLNGGVREPVPPRSILDVIIASLELLTLHGIQQGLAAADVVIAPDLGRASYHNLRKVDELFAAGERAAHEVLAGLAAAPAARSTAPAADRAAGSA